MGRWLLALAVLFGAGAAIINVQAAEPPATVRYVDLEQYAGSWYEVASIPNHFQKKCIGQTQATYSLMDNGRIKVVNQCETVEGVDQAEAIARVAAPYSNARLDVAFFKLFGWPVWWFAGDYWIIGLDEKNYQWAIVAGSADRDKYGWVLSREPQLSPGQWEEVSALLNAKGYDLRDFTTTPQPGGFDKQQRLDEGLLRQIQSS